MERALTEIEFEGLMAPFLLKGSFAVAVSGGADSFALALLAKHYADRHGLQMTALTVDHRLRENAASEARWVHDLLTTKNIKHEILVWNHDLIPTSKIQESARAARYALLGKWCQENKVEALLTAHHQDDQIETFFMRLAHRSGLKGLSSIRFVRLMPFGRLIRPLLDVSKARLIDTLRAFDCAWCEDPSNANDKFERVRFRKALSKLYEQEILSSEAVASSIQKLQEVDDFLDQTTNDFLKEYAFSCFPLHAFQMQHSVLQKRIISALLKAHMTHYMPPDASIDQLRLSLMQSDFKGATLGGLYFRRASGGMVVVRQEARKA